MRKFIIEIHPDGAVTCCEYEDPEGTTRAANDRAWLSGYRQALIHCDEQVKSFEGIKGRSLTANLMYESAAHVRDGAAKMYQKYKQFMQH